MNSATSLQVAFFVDSCKKVGFTPVVASDSVVRVVKNFAPGDMDAFNFCDSVAYGLLGLAPLKGGSIWGTDGGSVGGHVAVKNGQYVLNKSGTGKRFMAELKKVLAA